MADNPGDDELGAWIEGWHAGGADAREAVFAYVLSWSRRVADGRLKSLPADERGSDIMQDGVMKLLKQYADEGRRPTTPVALRIHVARALADAAIERIRDRGRPGGVAGTLPDDHPGDITSASRVAIRAEEFQKARDEVDGLPENEQEVILLAYFVGLETKQIAELCGITPRGVLRREANALEKLSYRLEPTPG